MQFIFRVVVGGLVASLFATLGDVLKPKSFAGLFGAAPSIALATLGLTVVADGKSYAAQEARDDRRSSCFLAVRICDDPSHHALPIARRPCSFFSNCRMAGLCCWSVALGVAVINR